MDSMYEQTKPEDFVTKYRVRTKLERPEPYCRIDFNFDEKGVVIPGVSQDRAHVFDRKRSAESAISRTLTARELASKGAWWDWRKFDPLRDTALAKPDGLIVEPFQVRRG